MRLTNSGKERKEMKKLFLAKIIQNLTKARIMTIKTRSLWPDMPEYRI
jgi:hypothetical protein